MESLPTLSRPGNIYFFLALRNFQLPFWRQEAAGWYSTSRWLKLLQNLQGCPSLKTAQPVLSPLVWFPSLWPYLGIRVCPQNLLVGAAMTQTGRPHGTAGPEPAHPPLEQRGLVRGPGAQAPGITAYEPADRELSSSSPLSQ